jgi:hypothetical protein
MGLLSWIMIALVILSIIGQGWNVFISSVFKGIDKLLNVTSPIVKDLDKHVKQYTAINNIPADIEKKNNIQINNV